MATPWCYEVHLVHGLAAPAFASLCLYEDFLLHFLGLLVTFQTSHESRVVGAMPF